MRKEEPNDAVAGMVGQWRRERPDLDASPMLVVGRLFRLAEDFDRRLRPPFAAAGLGNGDFDVLAALRRSGEPYTLSAGDLSRTVLVTTGAITKRVDRLEAKGLVARSVTDEDARGRRIALTPAGLALTDELMGVHLANQARLLEPLSAAEREALAALLAKLS
ncbi:MarR family winged helix-turn-helix transcriptional regulator [Glycomyces terrestris]|uniref:MarR family transcriptional regulator n=1 Tax=Glycomyces terrestris TaxID=2493553 RepID=A0A426UWE7_9ACTN|nr:MarR family winged helix-turn-helix transcriptional regulator [Glycomyces terrestris]RRR98666.1 MarR family transcriptional regulator [Glycomyces terrestris]